jgi:hypothetical protein
LPGCRDRLKIAGGDAELEMAKQTTSRWSAVAIAPGSSSCEAASALKGRRFLSAEAPRLPLPECTSQDACRCVYRKYPDRRAGPRRAEDHTGMRRSGSGTERRRGRGRRSTDL